MKSFIQTVTVVSAAVLAVASALPAAAHKHREPQVTGGGTTEVCNADALNPQYDANTGVQDCSDALQYQPMSMRDRVATTINRGSLRSRAGDLSGALSDFNAAISMDGNNAAAYLNRSATLLGLKHYTQAKADADKAIQLHARPIEVAYYNRAAAEEGLGDETSAYHDYKTALQMQPKFTAAANELTRFKVTGGGGNGSGGGGAM